MPSTLFGSMPRLMKTAVTVAREYSKVPDSVTDEEALAQGLISPELIELIMTIVQELMQNCLDNNSGMAWRRIRTFLDIAKPMDRLGDQVRLNWVVDRWLGRLGRPRDRGDVVFIREALVKAASGLTEVDFNALQIEVLWLTI